LEIGLKFLNIALTCSKLSTGCSKLSTEPVQNSFPTYPTLPQISGIYRQNLGKLSTEPVQNSFPTYPTLPQISGIYRQNLGIYVISLGNITHITTLLQSFEQFEQPLLLLLLYIEIYTPTPKFFLKTTRARLCYTLKLMINLMEL
jgi:hypothetical protein